MASSPHTTASDRSRVGLLAVFALACGIRLACLIQVSDTPMYSVLISDARAYDAWAQQIAAGDWIGREVFYQAPLYPYFLAFIYTVFGHDLFVIRLLQILLGSAACVLVALTGRRLFSLRAGLVAGAMLALYPPAIFFDLIIQKGSLSLFWMALLLCLLSAEAVRPGRRRMVWIGLVLGLFALTREHALVLIGLIPVWRWVHYRRTSRVGRIGKTAWFAAGLAAVLVPVGWRNYAVGRQFLITTSQFGTNLYIGNGARATGLYVPLRIGRNGPQYERLDATELAEADAGRPLTPREVSRYWTTRTWSEVRAAPGRWLRLMVRKWLLVWNAREFEDSEDLESYCDGSRLLAALYHGLHFGVICPLAAFGLCLTWTDRRRLWLLHALMVAISVSLALFFVFARYRLPLVPILVLFAAVGLVRGARFVAQRQTGRLYRAAVWGGLAAVAANWPILPGYEPRVATWNNLGTVLAEAQRYEEAVRFYRQALARSPAFPEAHNNLGSALAALGRTDEAMRQFAEALRLRPGYAGAHRNLGAAFVRQGRFDAAIEHFRAALHEIPNSVQTHYLLGGALESAGRSEEALQHYDRASQLQPDFAEAHVARGSLLADQGRLTDAEAAFMEALRQAPDYIRAHEHLAVLLVRQHRTAEAIRHYERAMELARKVGQTERAGRLRRRVEACRRPGRARSGPAG